MASSASWPPVSYRADTEDLRFAIADLRLISSEPATLGCQSIALLFNRKSQI
jgi:hypothetical protein